MSTRTKTLRTCPAGHRYYKSSDCPTCPKCEGQRAPKVGFLADLSAPARRALQHHGIVSVKKLASYAEKEVLSFHGIGPSSLPTLRKALRGSGLKFKAE